MRDFLASGEEILDLTEGMSKTAFVDNRLVQLAVEALMGRLGESVSRARVAYLKYTGETWDPYDTSPHPFDVAHPGIPWSRIRGVRNTSAHKYDIVDYGLIWNGVEDLPRIHAVIRRMLNI